MVLGSKFLPHIRKMAIDSRMSEHKKNKCSKPNSIFFFLRKKMTIHSDTIKVIFTSANAA